MTKQAHVEELGVLSAARRAVFCRVELAWQETRPTVLGGAATVEAWPGSKR